MVLVHHDLQGFCFWFFFFWVLFVCDFFFGKHRLAISTQSVRVEQLGGEKVRASADLNRRWSTEGREKGKKKEKERGGNTVADPIRLTRTEFCRHRAEGKKSTCVL